MIETFVATNALMSRRDSIDLDAQSLLKLSVAALAGAVLALAVVQGKRSWKGERNHIKSVVPLDGEEKKGRKVSSLRTPCLVVARGRVERNAARMRSRAARLGCVLRPHLKTSKTVQAATLQTGGSRRTCTVSTLAEAQFFTAAGFTDILYAVPLTQDKFEEASELTSRHFRSGGSFHVLVDSLEAVEALEGWWVGRRRQREQEVTLTLPFSVFISRSRVPREARAPTLVASQLETNRNIVRMCPSLRSSSRRVGLDSGRLRLPP